MIGYRRLFCESKGYISNIYAFIPFKVIFILIYPTLSKMRQFLTVLGCSFLDPRREEISITSISESSSFYQGRDGPDLRRGARVRLRPGQPRPVPGGHRGAAPLRGEGAVTDM